MKREEILLWMDAVADNWPWLGDIHQQRFVEGWWADLFDELRFECLERCPGVWAAKKRKSGSS